MMGLERLVANIEKHLSYHLESGQLDIEEYWTVLDFCFNNGYEEILNSALKYIDANFNTICSSKTNFSKLSRNIISIILENKNRTAQEIDIFKALFLWLENQNPPVEYSTRATLLGLVDLASVTPVDLLTVVRRSGCYTDVVICDALQKRWSIKHGDSTHEEKEVKDEVQDGIQRVDEENDNEEGIYPLKENLAIKDNKSLAHQDEAHQEDGQDEKSSPLPGNSLIKWWKSRDSLLSPSKGM